MTIFTNILIRTCICFILCVLDGSVAFASTDEVDLSVGMKTLPLLSQKITGETQLLIVFDSGNPLSKQEALSIKSILDAGFIAPGDLKLLPVLVPVGELGKLAGGKIAILTSGLGANFDAIAAAAEAQSILTMSTDISCVRANKCIIGIVSKPHVEIYYSKRAAEASKISFGQVFTMLVKQI